MIYSIVYSPLAIRDLERVYSEVLEGLQSSETASRYVDDMMDSIESKKDYPKSSAPLYYEGNFTGYNFVVFKAYIAFYRVDAEKMFVDRIAFGRSDYMRTIFRNLNL